jgi:hypothetical protein
MQQATWTMAHLTPDQERSLKEAEANLGAGVLLAFQKSDAVPTQLTPSQLECLHGLEERLGLVIVAVQPASRPAGG